MLCVLSGCTLFFFFLVSSFVLFRCYLVYSFFGFLDRETKFKDEDVPSPSVNDIIKISKLTDLIPDLEELFKPSGQK
jgi:hypothetical protein